MKNILVWETLSLVSGGQKMTLTVMDLLKDEYSFYCLLPEKGEMADELDKRGIPYTLMGNQTMPTGVKGKSVLFKYAFLSFKAIINALAIILKYKIDLIYAPGPAALPWSAVCAALTGKKAVWHLHHIFEDEATKKLLNICSKLKSVERIIAVSDCVRSQIFAPKGAKKSLTLYNPVDFERYSRGDKEKILAELNERGDSKENVFIAVIGLLQEQKKQERAIEILENLCNTGCKTRLLLVGSSRPGEQGYEIMLHELVKQKGLSDKVLFLGQRDDVKDILQVLSALIVPSTEGFSLVALEAMAAGVSVLAVANGGAGELVSISKGGVTYNDNESIDVIAQKLLKIMDDKELIKNGREFTMAQSPAEYKRKLLEIFG